MRVVVVGATGNVGTAVVRALVADAEIDQVVGVARRLPGVTWLERPKTSWVALDISSDPLDVVARADAVVHLAWKIQPSHDEEDMRRTNVAGTVRLLDAIATHRVPRLVYASSVGTYAPGPKRPPVDESWPATGVATSTYSRHKAAVETILDEFKRSHPDIAVARLRTSLVFQGTAASEVHRLFLGPLAPWCLPTPLRLVPRIPTLVAQATHSDDIADAYRLAVLAGREARSTWPPTRHSGHRSWRRSGGAAWCRFRSPLCGRRPPPRTACVCSRPSPAGSTWPPRRR